MACKSDVLHKYKKAIQKLFSSSNISMREMLGCSSTSSVIPTALICVIFGLAVPSLLFCAIFRVAFSTCYSYFLFCERWKVAN